MSVMQSTPTQHGPALRASLLALIGVGLLIVLVLEGSLISRPSHGSGEPSQQPAVVPPATSSPIRPSEPAPSSPTTIARDHLVVAARDGLRVLAERDAASRLVGELPPGQTAFVVDGPVARGGISWFLLSGLGLPPNTGCEEPYTIADCPAWIGWVAVEDTASLVQTQPACPTTGEYRDYASLQPLMRLVCERGHPVTLTAWWAGPSPYDTCIDSPPTVDWLYCALGLGGWLAPSPDEVGSSFVALAVDPSTGVVLPEAGRWINVTGHVDDPAASACSVVPGNPAAELASAEQVLQCRSTLVVDSVTDAAPE